MKQFLVLAVAMFGGLSSTEGQAYEFEDRNAMATDSPGGSMFVRNMSLLKVSKTIFNVMQLNGDRTINVTGNNDEDATYSNQEKDEAIGFMIPLGGASFGFDQVFSTTDSAFQVRGVDFTQEETFREKTTRAHFVVDLTQSVRGSFSYRYRKIENEIAGQRFVREDDRTQIDGSTTGYLASFYYDGKTSGFGMHYAPAMRGKSEIEGEEKILTTPGTAGFRFLLTRKKFTFGLTGTRWFYKQDDRQQTGTSPVNQTSISLFGIDMEQFLFNTRRESIGMDYQFKKDLSLRLNVFRQSGVFMFEEEAVPGDSPDRETAFSYVGQKLAVSYNTKKFGFQIGMMEAQRSFSEVIDPTGKIYFRYSDYKASDRYRFIGFNVVH